MQSKSVLLPPPLKRGDCIGLFSPSGPIRDQEKFDSGIRLLHELGFKTLQYPACEPVHDYLAAEDRLRAEEFHCMWRDREVNAMLAVRGGYGCLRMMPHLDLEVLRNNPKLVIGFSDITVLLNTLADRADIMTVHGPVLTSIAGSDNESLDAFLSLVAGNFTGKKVFHDTEVIRDGTATGILRGGNLTTLTHLLGTPWEVPLKNTILLLEDTGEPMYKLDRMLTQLYVSGRLEQLAGLLLGTFDFTTDNNSNVLQEEVWCRVLELTANTSFPIWGNIPVGHLSINHAIPIGMTATMNSANTELLIE